jgi:hypothetical protein
MQSIEEQPYKQVHAEYRAAEPLAGGKRRSGGWRPARRSRRMTAEVTQPAAPGLGPFVLTLGTSYDS